MGYVIETTLIRDYLAENYTNSKARSISFNADIIF